MLVTVDDVCCDYGVIIDHMSGPTPLMAKPINLILVLYLRSFNIVLLVNGMGACISP